MPSETGTWISRLDGDDWRPTLKVSADTTLKADGDLTPIRLLQDDGSQLASVQYIPGSNCYDFWETRPDVVSLQLPPEIETATIDIDSQERMWVA